jgi:glutamyl-tRNA synthetase
MSAAESLNALHTAGEVLDSCASFDDEAAVEGELRAASEKLGLKPAQFFGVLRVAVTGKTVTPPLVGTLAILGKAKAMARVERALGLLEQLAAAPA